MSHLPNDPELAEFERRIAELAARSLAPSPAKLVRVPAGHASRAQRRALAKRDGTLRNPQEPRTPETIVYDGADDPL